MFAASAHRSHRVKQNPAWADVNVVNIKSFGYCSNTGRFGASARGAVAFLLSGVVRYTWRSVRAERCLHNRRMALQQFYELRVGARAALARH